MGSPIECESVVLCHADKLVNTAERVCFNAMCPPVLQRFQTGATPGAQERLEQQITEADGLWKCPKRRRIPQQRDNRGK